MCVLSSWSHFSSSRNRALWTRQEQLHIPYIFFADPTLINTPFVNPIPTRGEGAQWWAHCAPRHTSSNISRTPCAGDLKLSDNLNELIFNRLRPLLVTIAMPKVYACFWKTHFGSFRAKADQNSTFFFFAISMKSIQNGVCHENLGLIFRLMVSWWIFSFRTHFRASTTLNLSQPGFFVLQKLRG